MAINGIKHKLKHPAHKLRNKSLNSTRFSKANLLVFALLFAGIGGYALIHSSSAATLNATPSTFAGILSSAQGGDTIVLAAGNYGNFNGGSKSSMVTIQAAPGTNPVFTGGDIGSSVRNITLKGVTFTGPIEITPGAGGLNFYLDGITMGSVGHADHEGRISVACSSGCGSSGVHIMNSKLGPGGCSDGIQVGAPGVEIGGNEITGIVQGGCSEHVDPIQLYGGDNANIHDNWIHGNSSGIMAPDGASGTIINNNVISAQDNYDMVLGDFDNGTVTHNVADADIYDGNPTNQPGCSGHKSTNDVYQNNVGTMSGCGTNVTNDHNLGSVTFTGGTGRCASATASPKGTASDGTDIGLNDCSGGTTPPPPPPTGDSVPPTVSMSAPANNATVSGSSVTVSATASDNVGVVGVQFKLDGNNLSTEDTSSPYSITWNSTTVTNGSHTLTAVARDAAGNTTTATNITVTTNNTTACTASNTSWMNNSFAAKTTTFSFDYDSTPQSTGIDAITGLGSGAATAYSSLAVIVRFNTSGTIDAVNGNGAGGNYTADATINYTAGTSYHFKITINPTSHTYSVVVTPQGGSATTIATNYPFRSEQATLSSFNNWTEYALSGSHTVCAATIGSGTTTKVGDLNNDNKVDIFDLSILLSNYSSTSNATADLNTDGIVNIFDLSILLSHYGA